MSISDRPHHWKTRIKNWLPVCAWACLIFFFSTDTFSSANTAQLFGFLSSWLFPEIPTEEIAPVHDARKGFGAAATSSAFLLDFAVAKKNCPAPVAGSFLAVGHHDNRAAGVAIDVIQQRQNRFSGFRVQVAGGFVRQ